MPLIVILKTSILTDLSTRITQIEVEYNGVDKDDGCSGNSNNSQLLSHLNTQKNSSIDSSIGTTNI